MARRKKQPPRPPLHERIQTAVEELKAHLAQAQQQELQATQARLRFEGAVSAVSVIAAEYADEPDSPTAEK